MRVVLPLTALTAATSMACGRTESPTAPERPPQPAVALVFTVEPTEVYPEVPLAPGIEVTAVTADGHVANQFNGVVRLELADTTLSRLDTPYLRDGEITVPAIGGVARFSDVEFLQPATRLVLVATSGSLSVRSVTFDVVAQPRVAYSTCAGWDSCDDISIIAFMGDGGSQELDAPDSFPAFSWDPAWSNDGTHVLFAGTRGCPGPPPSCGPDLFLSKQQTRSDYRPEQRLTHGEFSTIKLPAWSPDGHRIGFSGVAAGATPPERLYAMNADGSGVAPLGDLRGLGLAWSPDGRKISFSAPGPHGHPTIWIADADGSNAAPITQNDGIDAYPAWSPDGRKVLFVRTSWRGSSMQCQVYVTSVDGSPAIQLTRDPSCATGPAWSADGTRIVYVGSDTTGTRWLMLMNADGGGSRAIGRQGNGESRPAWARATP